jgi:SAM-dependent methyltransferase
MKEDQDRFLWAAKAMKIKSSDVLLEVGCGVGLAVEAITPLLGSGKIIAIDRSDKMIQTATKRNHAAIAKNKAEFIKTDLLHFPVTTQRFDKIFYFNINFFWTQKSIAKEAALMKLILSQGGSVFILYGPMVASGLSKIQGPVVENLANENFKVQEILYDKVTNCCCFICKP